ncbi:MAG: hypothetical protein NZ772_11680 [Cyanobacteria bacterium]|nr:hypothetical protein [Cyanobacteriota bacterium]MDW8201088.1 hypothetical protein [Cyanobacteriota bacterium SKYGB_h_bin112]
MVPLSRYWEILRLDPAADGVGYKRQLLPLAMEFFQVQGLAPEGLKQMPGRSSLLHYTTQQYLHQLFRTQSPWNAFQAATAGLCLRCYVSYAIVHACQRLARFFTSYFTYRDLLPFVLDDDGKTLIVLRHHDQQQLGLDADGTMRSLPFPIVSVEILRTYDPNRPAATRASLENWAYYCVRQQGQLKDFIAKQGLCRLSNWALLNRVSHRQLEGFSPHDRALISAFHRVYRRDRRRQHQTGKCPDPTPAQLQEMSGYLQQVGINLRGAALLHKLQTLAMGLRQLEQWVGGVAPPAISIDELDSETGQVSQLPDPRAENNVMAIERQEIQDFCHEQLVRSLAQAITVGLSEHVASIQRRPRYAKFANCILQGLWLIYSQGKSQTEIAPLLGMTNQIQVSRVLGLTELLNRVRRHTVEMLFHSLVKLVEDLDLVQIQSQPDYLNNLQTAIESFVDEEIFQAAAAELMTTKGRAFDSLYAQQLRHQIQTYQEVNLA